MIDFPKIKSRCFSAHCVTATSGFPAWLRLHEQMPASARFRFARADDRLDRGQAQDIPDGDVPGIELERQRAAGSQDA